MVFFFIYLYLTNFIRQHCLQILSSIRKTKNINFKIHIIYYYIQLQPSLPND